MAQCYQWLGERKRKRIRLAVMDMWKPFRNATNAYPSRLERYVAATRARQRLLIVELSTP
jgi:hypothetical protein